MGFPKQEYWSGFPFLFHFVQAATATGKSLQSCPTLCDPIDGSPPGSSVPGILQARTLEWVAISFSNAWKWKVKGKSFSRVWLSATAWTAAHPPDSSIHGISRQEYWSGVPLPSPCHLLLQGLNQVLLQMLIFNTPWNKFRGKCRNETLFVLGKTGRAGLGG